MRRKSRNSTAMPKKEKQTVVWNQGGLKSPQILNTHENHLKPTEKQILMLRILKLFEKKITVQRENSMRQNVGFMKQQNDLMSKIVSRNQHKLKQVKKIPSVMFKSEYNDSQLVSSEKVLAELDITNYNVKEQLQKQYQDLTFKIKKMESNLEKINYKQQKTLNSKYLNSLQQRLQARKKSLRITQNKLRNWDKYKEGERAKLEQQKQEIIQEYMSNSPSKYDKQRIKQSLLQLFQRLQNKV